MGNTINVSPYIREAVLTIQRQRPVVVGITAPDEPVFQRQQSAKMAALDWEKPVEPVWAAWLAGALIFAGIGVIIVASLLA